MWATIGKEKHGKYKEKQSRYYLCFHVHFMFWAWILDYIVELLLSFPEYLESFQSEFRWKSYDISTNGRRWTSLFWVAICIEVTSRPISTFICSLFLKTQRMKVLDLVDSFDLIGRGPRNSSRFKSYGSFSRGGSSRKSIGSLVPSRGWTFLFLRTQPGLGSWAV